MADSILDNRRSIRPRIDTTALHRSSELSETNITQILTLDVVSSKVTFTIPSTLYVTIEGAINSDVFFNIATNVNNTLVTYGYNLVKKIRLTRVSGEGIVTVVGISGNSGDSAVLGNVLDFPKAGKLYSYNTVDATDPLVIFSKPVGSSGIVRELQLIFEKTMAELKTVMLHIKYDGMATPSVSVPLAGLCGVENQDTVLTHSFETTTWDINCNADDESEAAVILRYPIPYTNGIEISLSGQSGGNWCNVLYQDNLPDCWNKNLRFFAVRSNEVLSAPSAGAGTIGISGTAVTGVGTAFDSSFVGKYIVQGVNGECLIAAVTDATHCTIAPSNARTLAAGSAYTIGNSHAALLRPPGTRGWLITTVGGFVSSSPGFLEANVRIFVDQETIPSLEWSGTEDYFNGSFYWTFPKQRLYGGLTSQKITNPYGYGAYKIFSNNPIPYTNGIKVVHPSIAAEITHNWTIVYYEEPITNPEKSILDNAIISENISISNKT